MRIIAFAIGFLAACTEIDVFVTAASKEGSVYECRGRDGRVFELCYLDDAAVELGAMIDATCGGPSRSWPQLTNFFSLGCAYQCPALHKGCNAKDGCYCP
jgi:hypothetical protein